MAAGATTGAMAIAATALERASLTGVLLFASFGFLGTMGSFGVPFF